MNEQEFIYGRLKYLTDQVNELTSMFERQQDLITELLNIVNKISSPQFMNQQIEKVKKDEILNKIEFMNRLTGR